MLDINGITWYLKFVPSKSKELRKPDGSYSIGVTDSNSYTIYIDETIHGALLKRVICHELTHAAIFSYQIHLSIDQEELIADLLATYGQEILDVTNTIFKRLRGEV